MVMNLLGKHRKRKKKKKKQPIRQNYNEQADKSLPLYTFTCLDNEFSPTDPIFVQCLHFRDDKGAIAFSKAYAKQEDWHKWDVHCGERPVYHRNLWTNKEVKFK